MGEWFEVKLGQLGEVNRGRSRHRPRNAPELYGGPYPFIQTGDIKASGGRITSHTQTYSELGLRQSKLWPKNTMVITIAANIAETAILTYPACFPDSVIGFVADPEKADVFFIEYLFRFLRRQIQHENVGTGSVQDNINLQTLERLVLRIPLLPEQRAIAAVLSALDDKIELNRRMNETLEGLVRALFRDWFVDFGPTRAKMAGEIPYLAPEIWSLFPDRLDEDGIPEGWDIVPLVNLAEVTMGNSPDGSTYNDEGIGTPLCNGPVEYGDFFLRQIKWTTAPNKLAKRGDLIICVRGSTTGRHAFADAEYCLGRGVASIRGKDGCQEFVETALLSQMNRLLEKTTGSVFPSLSMQDIKKFDLIEPGRVLKVAFCSAARPMRERIWANVEESSTLAQTRDLLLPKLMSGEIRVREAEAIVAKDNAVPLNQDLFGEPVLTDQQELERDAVIVAGVVRGFGRDGTHVVGNVRYQKGYLFVKRRLGDSVRDFQKMAAGPYSPDLAHDGGFVEACNRRFIKRASRNGHKGNVPADNMAQIGPLMDQYGIKDAIDWAIVRFRDKSRDELGLLATVDHIMCERKRMGLPINTSEIRKTLGADPKWKHKLSQPEFSEGSIRQAVSELERLFGGAS